MSELLSVSSAVSWAKVEKTTFDPLRVMPTNLTGAPLEMSYVTEWFTRMYR